MQMSDNQKSRVGDSLTLFTDCGHEGCGWHVTLVRKELPCDRWLVRKSDGRYYTLFVAQRTSQWFIMESSESMDLNGDSGDDSSYDEEC
jgi:hypothetical protein